MTTQNQIKLTVAEMGKFFKTSDIAVGSPEGKVMVELEEAVREIEYLAGYLDGLAKRMTDDLARAVEYLRTGRKLNACGTLQSAAEFEHRAGQHGRATEHAASLLKVAVAYKIIEPGKYTI